VKILMSVVLLISVASFAAAGVHQRAEPQQGAAMPMMQMMQDCPMNVQGAEITVADTSDGIALSLTTKSGNVEDLRGRVERLENMHSSPSGIFTAMPGMMVPGVMKYEAIPDGAQLTLTPRDLAKINEFRKQVRSHVERMKSEGSCAAVQDMMHGMMMGGMSRPSIEEKPAPK
jgi:hypothetical protein